MIQQPENILFASDLSTNMKQVFEHAVAMAAYTNAELVVLHVMEEAGESTAKRVRMAFGEALYENLKAEQKSGARNLLIGKNVDAQRIRRAIAGFFDGGLEDTPAMESPIKKILVTESRSVADDIVATAVEENCSVIVMGCRQQGLLAEAMGTKLVRKVLKRTSVPVYLVPLDES